MFVTDPWFLLVIVPGILAVYFLVHAVSPAASAWLLLPASATVKLLLIADVLSRPVDRIFALPAVKTTIKSAAAEKAAG